jgi:hypothetical protein
LSTNKNINQFAQLTQLYFRLYLGIAISIFLFVLFFQPFEPDKFEFENKHLFMAGFGLIVLIFLIISQIIFQRTLINKVSENKSNPFYIPLYYFFLVAKASLALIFYLRYVGDVFITFNTVVKVFFICLSLPVTMYLRFRIVSYQIRLKKLLHEFQSIQDNQKQSLENYANKHIEIISENESENFRIQVSEIVYIKSADNYVEIGYHDEGIVKKKMVRNTMRKVELQLTEYNNFIRTHRTGIVNIQYIDKLNKNLNTYWLSLDKTKETIPVSRQYLMAVKDVL